MESFHPHRGFTLIELVVVLAIIVAIMSIVFTGQNSFNKTLILANAAYDVALTLRSAETYGVGSRAGAGANVGYGVHLSGGGSNSFILFADTAPAASCTTPDCKPGDHVYTAGVDAPPVQTYTLGNGMTISGFCILSSASSSCTPGLSSLDIAFTRPNPTPFVSGDGVYSASYTGACLTVSSPHGGSRYVSVAASGEITANAASCP